MFIVEKTKVFIIRNIVKIKLEKGAKLMKNFKINSQNKLNVVKISITCFFIIILFIIALQVSFATDSIVSSITIKSNALQISAMAGS